MHIDQISWRSGFSCKVPATVAHAEIERIRDKKGGKVEAEDIVAAARSKQSKLHPAFEWDDAIAAGMHRVTVARNMVRSIEVIYVEAPERSVPLYQSVEIRKPSAGVRPKRAYQTLDEIMADPEKRSAMIGDAIADLVRVRRKYASLQELTALFAEIDKVAEELTRE